VFYLESGHKTFFTFFCRIRLQGFLMPIRLLVVFFLITGLPFGSLAKSAAGDIPPSSATPQVTILCYLNGDNNLAQEVLYALDMMETVGSSAEVNVIALVDGHPDWLGPYDEVWARTRLLHLQSDPQIGRITSPVLEEWGEASLGSSRTLERFVLLALSRFPAQRYVFYTFAHSQGIIDTRHFGSSRQAKVGSISRDDTNRDKMPFEQFHLALKRGLRGERFELMVLFSCLANMVEIGYALNDVTRYLVGSQDEIRLVNQPPGRFQLRGLRLEQLVANLHQAPGAEIKVQGRGLVDSHVADYDRSVRLPSANGPDQLCRFAGGMALIDTAAMPALGEALDKLARQLIALAEEPGVVKTMQAALSRTQPFASFLNLEYYDLKGFIYHLHAGLTQPALRKICRRILKLMDQRVLVYERHTSDCSATGLSIYLSHPMVPENIFNAHQHLYRKTLFSRDTHWDEMVEMLRPHLKGATLRASRFK
jgi:hypothetical protein